MGKALYIAEKPSVAQEFAKALKIAGTRKDGYLESEEAVVTWCLGHLVTMSYPEKYDEALKRWSLETLPFLPSAFQYEVIPGTAKQFRLVKHLLRRQDVERIYVCTDSGREGEYIYRLVEMMAGIKGKDRRRVWIDSQTEEEILRGIREAKKLEDYDNLAVSAYLRAKEDYLMGINFSRLLTLSYGRNISDFLGVKKNQVISVGRVMTCVLGMVVRREREIRSFVKTPFFRIICLYGSDALSMEGEWKVQEESRFWQSPALYKENGLKKEEDAKELTRELSDIQPLEARLVKVEKKTEKKHPPLLYNLAELQNDCSKFLKLSPDETLKLVQEMYEKKLLTYPRTDARVLSTAVAKEIDRNLRGLVNYEGCGSYAAYIISKKAYISLSKSRYVNDKQITDHYAIIPTGQGISSLAGLSANSQKVYEMVCRRFISIFYPPAEYKKVTVSAMIDHELFMTSEKVLSSKGYLPVAQFSFLKKKEQNTSASLLEFLSSLRKGSRLPIHDFEIREGETSPPKRYNSGSLILAMENAGQLVEDEELRAQIKGSGIGTSATRAEILKKLLANKYLALNKRTQIITPTLLGEMIFDVVDSSIRPLLNPDLTASWEKGLNYVAEGSISEEEYMKKLEAFIRRRTEYVMTLRNQSFLQARFKEASSAYKKPVANRGKEKE